MGGLYRVIGPRPQNVQLICWPRGLKDALESVKENKQTSTFRGNFQHTPAFHFSSIMLSCMLEIRVHTLMHVMDGRDTLQTNQGRLVI